MKHYFFPKAHCELLLQLVKREIQQRFKGSWLGLGWAIVSPLAMLLVYTFVFRTVLKAKWPGAENSDAEFALQIFSGLLIFALFSDVVARAPGLIVEQPNLVKKVVFPLEILSWVSVFTATFYALFSIVILTAAAWITRGQITLHLLCVPLIILMFWPMLMGLSWLISSLGVFLRDLGHLIPLVLTPMMFLSPIFYPASALPELGQLLMQFNPLTFVIESFRTVVLDQQWPDFTAMMLYSGFSILSFVLGAFCMAKTRRGFADVL